MDGMKKWFMGFGNFFFEISSIEISSLRDKEVLKENQEFIKKLVIFILRFFGYFVKFGVWYKRV